ncbi:uncharacterized protein LOC144167201 [Haemaphysalis longicornis]
MMPHGHGARGWLGTRVHGLPVAAGAPTVSAGSAGWLRGAFSGATLGRSHPRCRRQRHPETVLPPVQPLRRARKRVPIVRTLERRCRGERPLAGTCDPHERRRRDDGRQPPTQFVSSSLGQPLRPPWVQSPAPRPGKQPPVHLAMHAWAYQAGPVHARLRGEAPVLLRLQEKVSAASRACREAVPYVRRHSRRPGTEVCDLEDATLPSLFTVPGRRRSPIGFRQLCRLAAG